MACTFTLTLTKICREDDSDQSKKDKGRKRELRERAGKDSKEKEINNCM